MPDEIMKNTILRKQVINLEKAIKELEDENRNLRTEEKPKHSISRDDFQDHLQAVLKRISYLDISETEKLCLFFEMQDLVQDLRFEHGFRGDVAEIIQAWSINEDSHA